MRRASWLASIVCGLWALGAIPAGPGCALLAPAAWGQNFGQRTVSGAVLDANEQPVVGATVFLRNPKTKAIRSYISTEKGHYYFAQVEMNIDFDLWAEKDGKKSATKTVSSWDDRKDFVTDLKIK
ncbi:MAG: carboxypeptidase-like regulatory domain-containing protein [Terracidiphilus sp.]